MAIIQASRSESSDEGFDRKQIARVKSGLYGGMFAWYSLPKMMPRYKAEGEEERFFCGFTLTHDRTNTKLPNFSEAMVGVKPKMFYDKKTGWKTTYVALLFALFGGKKPYEEIAWYCESCQHIHADGNDNCRECDCKTPEPLLVDLDEYIGRPAIMMIEQNDKPDKHGLYGHRIKSIEPADKGLIAAIKPLYASKVVETVGQDNLARLKVPCAAYEDASNASPGDAGDDGLIDDPFDDDSVPF